jgi:hypothetical protein
VEVFLERLLVELLAIAAQLVVMRIVTWLLERSKIPSNPADLAVAA